MTTSARICTYPACQQTHQAKGLCNWHYKQHRAGEELRPRIDWTCVPCRGPLCKRTATSNHGCCTDHRVQQRTKGVLTPLGVDRVKPCPYPTCTSLTTRAGAFCKPHGDTSTDLVRHYGISIMQRATLAEQQGHTCAVCGEHPGQPYDNSLYVDHCHTTGQVRGLLCNHCNIMLGMAKDRPDVLLAGAAYLTDRTPQPDDSGCALP